jgi:nucleotide-binding universal stress UspA family protein
LYKLILVGLDGSRCSDLAVDSAISLASMENTARIIGCHVYSAKMHKSRFTDMETGLPEDYQGEGINYLRDAHNELIFSGLKLISESYLESLSNRCREIGIDYEGKTPEGRNYIQLLRLAGQMHPDLVILGAWGQGQKKDIGSTAERFLLYSKRVDVLLMRKKWIEEGTPIVVGVDGSQDSFFALSRALEMGTKLDLEVRAISVFDPFFHSGVFRLISSSLSKEAREKFDLPSQEEIHDQIIAKGLESLYRESLEKGLINVGSSKEDIQTEVIAGEICRKIQEYASSHNASLVVLGRWGLHMEKGSLIGSHSLRLVRELKENILIVS